MAAAYRAPPHLSCAPPAAVRSHATRPTACQYPPITEQGSLSYSSRAAAFRPRIATFPCGIREGRGRSAACRFFCKYSGIGTAIVVTAATWRVSVLNSKLPVLVEFYASWCGPCRMVDRVVDEIAEEYAGRLKCYKLNADYNPKLALDHGIERVPTVLLFKNGERLESITGTMPKSVYVRAIDKCLAS